MLAWSAQYTPGMKARLDELLKTDWPMAKIDDEMERLQAEELIGGVSDIEREWMNIGGIDVQQVTVGHPMSPTAFEDAVAGMALWQRKLDCLDYLVKATRYEHVERAKAEGKRAIILGFQDSDHFGTDLDRIQIFYDMGMRLVQLTYNLRNFVGDGWGERVDGGLSRFGVKVLKRLNELGILVDLSHCGHRTTMDAIELSSSAPIVTHSFARGLWDNPRGSSDEEIEGIGARNGFFGVLMTPIQLTGISKGESRTKCTIDDILDHVDYVARMIGADKVGFGSDYNGEKVPALLPRVLGRLNDRGWEAGGYRPTFEALAVEGFADIREWPNVTSGLVARGYSDEEIKGILGGNFLRIFEEVCG
ncbi:MAG: membrane dipeptidase [Chloroflexi bacterium]|nr:membrane dipeptidase [Chloroflexota bacterium]